MPLLARRPHLVPSALAASFSLAFALGAAPARATEPVVVHAALHPHREGSEQVTYVDISVTGARSPIRLMRRVSGACTVDPTPPPEEGPYARVACTTADASVTFEVAREDDDLVVRKDTTPLADAGAGADADAGEAVGPQVIARAELPPRARVQVR